MNKKLTNKNIFFFVPLFLTKQPYGNEIISKSLIKHFSKKNNVTVFTSDVSDFLYWKNFIKKTSEFDSSKIRSIKIIRLEHHSKLCLFFYVLSMVTPFLALRNYFFIRSQGPYIYTSDLKKIFSIYPCDIVYTSTLPHFWNIQTSNIIKTMTKKPVFIIRPEIHSSHHYYSSSMWSGVFTYSSLIHVLTNTEKNFLSEKFLINKSKFAVIPNFISKVGYLSANVYRNNSEEINILFFGKKTYCKGIFLLANSIQKIIDIYKNKKIKLYIFGKDTKEWNMYKNFRRYTFVKEFGYVTETKKKLLICKSDIVCIPSTCDSFGMAYLEAWAQKKPVIGGNNNETRDVIQLAQGGLSLNTNSIYELIDKILILINNSKLRKKMGFNGYNALIKSFFYAKNVQELEKRIANFFS